MTKPRLQRTPKIFASSYRPTQKPSTKQLPVKPLLKIGAIFVGLFLISQLPIFKIQEVVLDDIPNKELAEDLKGLAGTSIFSGKIATLTQDWLKKDTSIAAITCRRGLPNALRCSVLSHEPAVIWKKGDTEYLVSKEGILFSLRNEKNFSGPVIDDQAPLEITLGSEVASATVIDQINRLFSLLKEAGIETRNFYINDSLYQLGLVITGYKSVDGTQVTKELTALVVTTQALEGQVDTIRTVLHERGTAIDERIDVRVPGYVYFK